MYNVSKQKINKNFDDLNEKIFNNKLPEFDRKMIYRQMGCWGGMDWKHCKYGGDTTYLLLMNYWYHDERHFLSVLGHEMVHFYQHLRGDSANHNKMFYSFKPKFEKHGLILKRTMDGINDI